jgi:hypothetical protein
MAKTTYHLFKRVMRDSEAGDPPWLMKARVLPASSKVTIRLTEQIIREAIQRNGQADSQNCAGAVCVIKQRRNFDHPVSGLVDWWRRRVFIAEPTNERNGKTNCRIYAHFDDVEELFDTPHGLKKLLNRVIDKGYIDITLYPIKKGKHPKTGKPTRPTGGVGSSGKKRQPRRVGDELRLFNYTRTRQAA